MMAETGDGSSKTIRFRNYQPNDKTLANKVVKTNVSTFDSTMQQTASKNELDLLRNELSILDEEIGGAGSINIMPKKANWDLKNTIEHKLEKLKRLTQKSIVKILREKITEDNENEE